MLPDNQEFFSDEELRNKLQGFEPPLPLGSWPTIQKLQAENAGRPVSYAYAAALFICLALYLGFIPNQWKNVETITIASTSKTLVNEAEIKVSKVIKNEPKLIPPQNYHTSISENDEVEYVNKSSKTFKPILADNSGSNSNVDRNIPFQEAGAGNSIAYQKTVQPSYSLFGQDSNLETLNPELRQAELTANNSLGLSLNAKTQEPNKHKPSFWDNYKREITVTPRLVTGLYHPDNANNLLVLPANQQQDNWRFRNAFQVSFSLTRDFKRAFVLAGASMQSIHETVNIRLDLPTEQTGTLEPGMRTTQVKLDANYLFAGLRAGGGYWLDKSKKWRTSQVFTFSRLMRGSARFSENEAVISSLRFPAAGGPQPNNLVWSTSLGYHQPLESGKGSWFVEPGVSYMLYSNTPKNQPGTLKPFMVDIHLGLRW